VAAPPDAGLGFGFCFRVFYVFFFFFFSQSTFVMLKSYWTIYWLRC